MKDIVHALLGSDLMTASDLTIQAWITLLLIWLVLYALYRCVKAIYKGREIRNWREERRAELEEEALRIEVELKRNQLERSSRFNSWLGIDNGKEVKEKDEDAG